jgi:cytochrome c peroxidase
MRRSWTFLPMLLLAVAGCRRDPSWPADAAPAPGMPFSLALPWWADDGVHPARIPADNPFTAAGVELGRRLFYEKALSDDFSMSCGTCHMQEFAFGDQAIVPMGTDGSQGRRNAPPIINVLWHEVLFWDGRSPTLEDQALHPVRNPVEMRNSWPVVEQRLRDDPRYPPLFKAAFGSEAIDSLRVTKAIAQFQRTLLSFNSRFDRWHYLGEENALTEQEQRGFDLFMGPAHCVDCHRPPHFHDLALRNIGLPPMGNDAGQEEVTGLPQHRGRFKTTTLRNIAVTAPYMHDGRFATLEQVIDFYADQVQQPPNLDPHMLHFVNGEVQLSPQDRADLKAFLLTLTDEHFLTDPRFADPH